MAKTEYRYYLLKDRWLARLKKGAVFLETKEFYKNGTWLKDEKLNLMLNDCMMDYGDYHWYEYDDITEDEAFAFIERIEKQSL